MKQIAVQTRHEGFQTNKDDETERERRNTGETTSFIVHDYDYIFYFLAPHTETLHLRTNAKRPPESWRTRKSKWNENRKTNHPSTLTNIEKSSTKMHADHDYTERTPAINYFAYWLRNRISFLHDKNSIGFHWHEIPLELFASSFAMQKYFDINGCIYKLMEHTSPAAAFFFARVHNETCAVLSFLNAQLPGLIIRRLSGDPE